MPAPPRRITPSSSKRAYDFVKSSSKNERAPRASCGEGRTKAAHACSSRHGRSVVSFSLSRRRVMTTMSIAGRSAGVTPIIAFAGAGRADEGQVVDAAAAAISSDRLAFSWPFPRAKVRRALGVLQSAGVGGGRASGSRGSC